MANKRIKDLTLDATPSKTDVLAVDSLTTRGVTIENAVKIGRPFASQAQAEAGTDYTTAMSPLTVKQAIAAQGAVAFATAAQGAKADSAVQPALTISAGDGLTGGGTLAANRTLALNSASIASLALADSAIQAADLSAVATSGDYADLANLPTLGTAAATDAADYATAAQGATADSAVQPGDLGSLAAKNAIAVPSDITASGTASASTYLRGDGSWGNPSGATAVQSIVPGDNITVDNTDPNNPVVSSSGGVAKVYTKTALKDIDTTKETAAILLGSRDRGVFSWEGSSQTGGNVSRPVGVSTSVASSTFTMTPHRLLSRQAVCVTSSANGLTTETIYYVIKVTDNTFKLATTFADAVAGTAITLTGTTNMTFLRLMDPLQGVYIIPTGKSITGSDGAWVRNEYLTNYDLYITWFGAVGNGVADDTPAMFFMLDFCEKHLRSARFGGRCFLSKGTYNLTSMIRIGTSTILQGAGMYASTMAFNASYTSGHCIELGPDNVVDANGASVYVYFGAYTFNTLLSDIDIKGGNTYRGGGSSLVYTQGTHQPSGLIRCFIREVVNTGISLQLGNGGPANFTISHCDIEAGTTVPTTGNKVGISCNMGGAMIDVDTVNIQGGASTFLQGIQMVKDHLVARALHFENCSIGITAAQNQTLILSNTIIGASGHSSVPILIQRSNPTKNKMIAINASNQSTATTGLVVIRDNGVNVSSDTVVPFYNGP